MPTTPHAVSGNRVGSLCSGYGGLDLAVLSVLGGQVAWHAENDPDAAVVLAHHWPDVPNHGDLRTVDWAAAGSVDVLVAGFPCQPVSYAGRKKGIRDPRWLWDDIAEAVGRMDPRPGLLVLENVRGLLTADRGHAMARVVHRLARLGYVGSWRVVRAADIGAPHARARVFLAAWLTDRPLERPAGNALTGNSQTTPTGARQPRRDDRPAAHAHGQRRQGSQPAGGRDLPDRGAAANTSGDRRDERRAAATGDSRGSDAALGGDPPGPGAAIRHRPGWRPTTRRAGRVSLGGAGTRQVDQDQKADEPGGVDWGPYGPAITRWEHILGRPAPRPTVPGRRGTPVLNPALVEWMLGLPAGWVTAVPGLSRAAMLRILGNGVCPQQAAAALRLLLPTNESPISTGGQEAGQ